MCCRPLSDEVEREIKVCGALDPPAHLEALTHNHLLSLNVCYDDEHWCRVAQQLLLRHIEHLFLVASINTLSCFANIQTVCSSAFLCPLLFFLSLLVTTPLIPTPHPVLLVW